MWAHSGWTAGFWKHPPLLPWITEAWTMFVPMSLASLSLLTAVNMTVCAWAVWRIAAMSRHAEDARIGILAILLLICVPFASVMAVKLNHNAILISIWPLTALAFLRALDQPTALRGLIFGIAAAAAVLAKYYSGLLLLGCVAASFADPLRAARFYRGPAPYVAVAVFAVADGAPRRLAARAQRLVAELCIRQRRGRHQGCPAAWPRHGDLVRDQDPAHACPHGHCRAAGMAIWRRHAHPRLVAPVRARDPAARRGALRADDRDDRGFQPAGGVRLGNAGLCLPSGGGRGASRSRCPRKRSGAGR